MNASNNNLDQDAPSGIALKPTRGNGITLTPPLLVTREGMNRAQNVLEECFIKPDPRA